MSYSSHQLKDEVQLKLIPWGTNDVLTERNQSQQFYYLPCYLRFKVKNILSLEIQNLTATVSGALLISIYYGNLEQSILEQFLSVEKIGDDDKRFRHIIISFAKDQGFAIKNQIGVSITNKQKQKRFDITIRKSFICEMEGQLFLSPFQLLNLYLSITIQSVRLNPTYNKNKDIQIKFNAMDTNSKKIGNPHSCTFGQYFLCKSKLDAKYMNSSTVPYGITEAQHLKEYQIHQNSKEKKPKHFQYVHFNIPIYKNPANSLVTVFLPLFIVAILTLAVFFQGVGLGNALQNLGTLMIAFVAFIPTIHEEIPAHPSILGVQIMIYIQISTSFLALLRMFLIKDEDPTQFVYNWRGDGLFLAALIINIINATIIIILYLVHKLVWEPNYNIDVNQGKSQNFSRNEWNNDKCDQQFAKFQKIKPLINSNKIKDKEQ